VTRQIPAIPQKQKIAAPVFPRSRAVQTCLSSSRADRLAANLRPALPASDDRQIPDAQCVVALTCSSVTQQTVLQP
jgi:hypothetical protein